uniref:BRCT domain-containing protein n=1 Tax=Panagrolaimus sp. ES5 TaxID=591445 RepID=A0AC34GYA2_9BILA
MTINGQTMFATVPTTPGTPTSGPPRVAYQIQQAGQFSYAQPQQPQHSQQNQQWVTIQPQQMQFAGQPRIAPQQIQRNGTNRFPPGFQAPIQSSMIYASNVPGSPHPQRIAIRPQIVTTQIQQNQTQQASQTPGTPTTPANHQMPSTPTPQQLGGVQPIPGGYYPSQPLQGYPPNNYPQNGSQVNFSQQRHQAPSIAQSSGIRQFVPTNNVHGNPQVLSFHFFNFLPRPQPSQAPPNPYSTLPTINGGGQQRPKSVPQQQQQIPPGHFSSHISQANVNKQGIDMRSPALISPNQAVQKLPTLPGHSHNMNQMTPRPQQHSLRMTPQFFYPEVQNNVPPELCFAGCYFLYAENPNSNELHTLIRMIRYYGGEVDVYNVRNPSDKSTHVICEYAAHVSQILEQKNKRVCTVAWINDIIEKRRMEPPFKVCHLPSLAVRNPLVIEKVISITGFTEHEAASIKLMTQLIGAKFSPFLSKHSNILIAKSPNSPKVEKALKLFGTTVQIVNLSWLCELYMGLTAPLNDSGNRRFNVNTNVPLEVGPVTLSKFHENIGRMMAPWQYPLTITEEHLKRAKELRASVLNDENVFASIKYSNIFSDGIIPSDGQIYATNKLFEEKGCKPELKIAFTGFDLTEVDILTRKITILGVEVVDKIEKCHLLIAPFLVRSTSIFKAVASGKGIISPLWIATCFNRLKLVDSDDFVLRDINAEKILGCNLRHTLVEARLQPIFENICFFVTPSVKPSRQELQSIIEAGGGTIDKAQPSRFTLQKYLDVSFV